ncbi:MAG: hypothetical protein ACK5LK_07930 [Chthoniobacterales bacterium]
MIFTGPVYVGNGKVVPEMVYRSSVTVGGVFARAVLEVEPTLMSGRFTLEIGQKRWEFCVSDVDAEVQEIDLTEVLKANEPVPVVFMLHEPVATEGIKYSPRIVLS